MWSRLDDDDVPELCAHMCLKMGRAAEAVFYFREFIRRCPKQVTACTMVNLAGCLRATGDLKQAESVVDHALQRWPDYEPALSLQTTLQVNIQYSLHAHYWCESCLVTSVKGFIGGWACGQAFVCQMQTRLAVTSAHQIVYTFICTLDECSFAVQMCRSPLRTLIVGCGRFAHDMSMFLKADERCQVVGVSDPSDENCTRIIECLSLTKVRAFRPYDTKLQNILGSDETDIILLDLQTPQEWVSSLTYTCPHILVHIHTRKKDACTTRWLVSCRYRSSKKPGRWACM